jgi:hypothetical protein
LSCYRNVLTSSCAFIFTAVEMPQLRHAMKHAYINIWDVASIYFSGIIWISLTRNIKMSHTRDHYRLFAHHRKYLSKLLLVPVLSLIMPILQHCRSAVSFLTNFQLKRAIFTRLFCSFRLRDNNSDNFFVLNRLESSKNPAGLQHKNRPLRKLV